MQNNFYSSARANLMTGTALFLQRLVKDPALNKDSQEEEFAGVLVFGLDHFIQGSPDQQHFVDMLELHRLAPTLVDKMLFHVGLEFEQEPTRDETVIRLIQR